MSRKVIVNGESICYLPPVDASEINYTKDGVTTTVEQALENKVSKSGDTMTGNLTVNRSNTGTTNLNSVLTLGNNIPTGTTGTSRGIISLYSYSDKQATLYPENLSEDRYVMIPDKTGTISLTSDLDIESLTFSAPAFSDTSNIKVTRTGKIIKVSFSGVILNTAIGQYGAVMRDLPINTTGYSVGVLFLDQNDNDKQVSFYINDNSTIVQTNNALPVGAKIWGSFIYFG